MGQHDFTIDNAPGATVRADLNAALQALASNNSGTTEPATPYAYQLWADTTTGLLKIRNAVNNAWIIVGTLASAYLGLALDSAVAKLASDNKFTGHQTFQGRVNVASSVAGTVDAITAVFSPTFTAWVDKMRGTFRAGGANTSTTPTFAPDGLAAKTFVKENLAALAAGDIVGAGHEVEWIYNATADKVILLNPKGGAAGFTGKFFKACQLASPQAIPQTTWTKVILDNEIADADNVFENATNYRIVIPIGETWELTTQIAALAGGTNYHVKIAIYKNGSPFALGMSSQWTGETGECRGKVSTIATGNGTDYYEVYVYRWDSAANLIAGEANTYFYGQRVK